MRHGLGGSPRGHVRAASSGNALLSVGSARIRGALGPYPLACQIPSTSLITERQERHWASSSAVRLA